MGDCCLRGKFVNGSLAYGLQYAPLHSLKGICHQRAEGNIQKVALQKAELHPEKPCNLLSDDGEKDLSDADYV